MTAAQQRILVVDDDPEIRKLLARYIESQGFRVQLAANCRELHDRLAEGPCRLSCSTSCCLTAQGSKRAAICALSAQCSDHLLTALKEDVDRIIGLEIGADDYLGKPFNPRELIARVRAVLRRRAEALPPASETKIYRFEGFTADPQTRRVTGPHGGDIELTGAEFDLLRTFLDRPGRVLSRDQLLDLTRGRDGDVLDRSIDVLVSRLRRKLADGGTAQLFKTVRNGGYQLAAKVEVQGAAP